MQTTNLTISQKATPLPIIDIAKKIRIKKDNIILYGNYIAKVHINQFSELGNDEHGKLILVTSITPTKEGEGKTTATIGIAQALGKLGKNTMICIRQPSMGPVFGIKGGGCGGGFSQVLPTEDINMHFTGDIHSVTTSCNLLSAIIDNSINNDNPLNLDIDNIIWRRAIDMNDKSLRNVIINSGNKNILNHDTNAQRVEHFDITSASEVMAILSLTLNYSELKSRLGKIIIGFTKEREAIYSESLKIHNAMAAVLKNAIHPNLVQSIENIPAFVHGGAFGNVAHGCNSLIATKMALGFADYVVTEAGFGADLGAEKFFDIKCRVANLNPSAVVIVVTVKALKMHGQGIELSSIEKGFENLEKQIENVRKFNMEPLVAINKFQDDKGEEHNIIIRKCNELRVSAFVIDVYLNGGNGALEIAQKLIRVCDTERELRFLYDVEDSIEQKVGIITREMFGARNVNYSTNAKEDIRLIEENNLGKLPICMAKTQKSLSDNPKRVGRPKDFDVTVTKVRVSAGAGFIVVYLGDILTMQGLPKIPSALNIDIDKEGRIIGLF